MGAWRYAALMALGVFVLSLWRCASIQPDDSGSSGYFNFARLKIESHPHLTTRTIFDLSSKNMSPFAHSPLGFRPTDDTVTNTPIYAPALPEFSSNGGLVREWELGPKLLLLLRLLAGVLLTYALAHHARWVPMPFNPIVVLVLAPPWRRVLEHRDILVHGNWIAGLFGQPIYTRPPSFDIIGAFRVKTLGRWDRVQTTEPPALPNPESPAAP